MKAWPIAAFAGGAAALAAFALLYRADPARYIAILDGWGVTPFRFPFLDTHAVLSALQCTARGFDTYQANPCDVLTRAFVYSPLILDAAAIPVSLAWNNGVGIALAVAFFLAVASLPAPRGAREWTIMALAGFSAMSVFAIERGNIDVLIFVLMTGAVHLLRGRSAAARGAGYAVIVFAALLKYYPIVAMIAALRERPRRFAVVVAVSAAVGALFLVHYWRPLHEAMTRVPSGSYFTDLFGAGNLPNGLFLLLRPLAARWPATAPFLLFLPSVLLVLLIYYAARNAVALTRDAGPVTRLPPCESLFLVVGASLIVGCFFAGQSIAYRGVFFLMLLPGLLATGREPGGRQFAVAAWLIVFLMWGETVREALQRVAFHDPGAAAAWQALKVAFWMFREMVWWRVIGTLAGLVLCFALASDTATAALAALRTSRRARQ